MDEERGPTTGERDPTPGERDTLEAVQNSVLRLVSRLPRLPSALRVVADGVTIEAEWAGGPAIAGAASEADVAGLVAASGGGETEPADDDDLVLVRSPTVGSFFRAPKPGAPPFVVVGDTVAAGQQVAVIESMKLLFAVEAGVDGTVVAILKDDAAPVEHDEPLISLRPQPLEP